MVSEIQYVSTPPRPPPARLGANFRPRLRHARQVPGVLRRTLYPLAREDLDKRNGGPVANDLLVVDTDEDIDEDLDAEHSDAAPPADRPRSQTALNRLLTDPHIRRG